MRAAPSLRRRLLAGLAVALALGVGGEWLLLRAERESLAAEVATRQAVVSTLALAQVAARVGGAGEPVRAVLKAWQEGRPPGTEARVVLLGGISLEGSTAPQDTGERAAPRRLAREEKELFDRAQRLRGAVGGNREGGATKPELEVERRPDGGLRVAVPLEADGQVVGLVQVDGPPSAPGPGPGPLPPLLCFALPLLAFLLVARWLGERPVPLVTAATLALALAILAFAAVEVGDTGRAHRAAHQAVADRARAELGRLAGPAELAGAPALDPAAWDADAQRRPRGLVTSAGGLDEARVDQMLAKARGDARASLLAAALLAALALALVGGGVVQRVGRAVVVHQQAYRYVAPAMIGTTVLVFFPFIYGIALSFTSSNIYTTNAPLTELWVGFKNYWTILSDFGIARRGADGTLVWNYLNFYWTFLFTVVWTITNVVFGVSFGLLLALILNTKDLAFRPIYRVLLILPWAMPNYITALIWKGMFHRQFGVANQVLAMVGLEPISWFDSPFTSYLTALATNGWLSFPFMMVVSLGALQSIPADIYEAARVDGASRWQQFRAITLPSLKPALVPAVILSVVWTFNMFNIIYLVSGGAPNGATEILITQAYKYAFEKYQYGYAAAYSTVIFGILLIYGNVQNRINRATEAI